MELELQEWAWGKIDDANFQLRIVDSLWAELKSLSATVMGKLDLHMEPIDEVSSTLIREVCDSLSIQFNFRKEPYINKPLLSNYRGYGG